MDEWDEEWNVSSEVVEVDEEGETQVLAQEVVELLHITLIMFITLTLPHILHSNCLQLFIFIIYCLVIY